MNKRYFSMRMLTMYYRRDKQNGIGIAIGKTEGFIFKGNKSEKIVTLWLQGKKDKANKLMEEYVSRISY
jgi:hypothetical protein